MYNVKNFLILGLVLVSLGGCVNKHLEKKKNSKEFYKSNTTIEAAWETGKHTNFFVEKGIATHEEVDQKLNKVYQQLFYTGNSNQKIFVPVGKDMGYIHTIDTNDIRSEGMSYGMIISVMMGDKSMFDKLWKFSKTYMQHESGGRKGYFAWSLSTKNSFAANDPNPAPDGEEYFVMSLFFAKNRWGNGDGIYNYEKEANAILTEMIHKESSVNKPLFHSKEKQIIFTPDMGSLEFSDPSYHLPGFTELWVKWAENDKEFLREVTNISREYFVKASHPETGLFPDYGSFEGKPQSTPYNKNSHNASHDSHRVIQNIAMDYLWFKKDTRQLELVEKNLDFVYNEYVTKGKLVGIYSMDGKPMVTYSTESQVAMNAVGATITNKDYSKYFIKKLWNQKTPSGKYRYYNGLLHMLAMLHVSGEFKIYGNPRMNNSFEFNKDF